MIFCVEVIVVEFEIKVIGPLTVNKEIFISAWCKQAVL